MAWDYIYFFLFQKYDFGFKIKTATKQTGEKETNNWSCCLKVNQL